MNFGYIEYVLLRNSTVGPPARNMLFDAVALLR
jgi:hypothetical protein